MAKVASPPAPANRLPSTRESRPALIGLALLLIIGGALASAYLALVAGDRADFVQISQEVAQGEEITEEHLQTVSLPEGYDGGVPAADIDEVVGQSTTVRLLPGTVLTPDMVSDDGGLPADKAQLDVEISQTLAAGLQAGDRLTIYVGESNGGTEFLVAAELVALGEADEDSIGGTGQNVVPAVVQVDNTCTASVARGIKDNAIQVGVGRPPSSGDVETCGG